MQETLPVAESLSQSCKNSNNFNVVIPMSLAAATFSRDACILIFFFEETKFMITKIVNFKLEEIKKKKKRKKI